MSISSISICSAKTKKKKENASFITLFALQGLMKCGKIQPIEKGESDSLSVWSIFGKRRNNTSNGNTFITE
jgi:hypothetical protein